ncbi:MAG: 16S rRNA (cytidine(1402)-2'-O)-methyltransferase [Candidatus Promineifilaceae bacterium]
MGTLYLVATPIGNLEDMTFRAVRILREVGRIAAEDTRHSGKLLKHFEINTPLTSFHEHSDNGKVSYLVELLAEQDIALISDAGTPSISDPGFRLARAAIDAGHQVTPIPGANAATTALIASGLPTNKYLFLGFLPAKQKARQTALQTVAELHYTLVFYESPNRLVGMLEDVGGVLGLDRPISVGRELTKLHEEHWRGTVQSAITHYKAQQRVRGEITVTLGGKPFSSVVWDESQVRSHFHQLMVNGMKRSQAANETAKQSGWRKKNVYNLDIR